MCIIKRTFHKHLKAYNIAICIVQNQFHTISLNISENLLIIKLKSRTLSMHCVCTLIFLDI